MPLPDQARIDVGLALAAQGQAAPVAIDLADLAGDEALRQQRLERTARRPAAIDGATRRIGTALAELGRVEALQPQLLARQPQRIAVDRAGGADQSPGRAEAVLQNRAGDRQQANDSKGYYEIDGAADPPPAEGAEFRPCESKARHQEELNDLPTMMASPPCIPRAGRGQRVSRPWRK
jgi:hypothetical protein